MNLIFYIAAGIAVIATIMAISRHNAIHALLYLILSLLAVSVIFYILGAPLVAALEVLVYAGAIMVLFIFVVMMLNIGMEKKVESRLLRPTMWIFPGILSAVLFGVFIYVLKIFSSEQTSMNAIDPKQVGITLFTKYTLGVEIAAMLLLVGIVGAYHLGKQRKRITHRFLINTAKKK